MPGTTPSSPKKSALARNTKGCGWLILVGIVLAGLIFGNSFVVFRLGLMIRDDYPTLQKPKTFQAVVFGSAIVLLWIEIVLADVTRSLVRRLTR